MLKRRQLLGGAKSEIASAIVHALPGRAAALRARLGAMPGVEIHAETHDGRFVISVEDSEGGSTGDTLLALHRIEEVLAAALVAHYEAR
jgi:nitrate reductase NapD